MAERKRAGREQPEAPPSKTEEIAAVDAHFSETLSLVRLLYGSHSFLYLFALYLTNIVYYFFALQRPISQIGVEGLAVEQSSAILKRTPVQALVWRAGASVMFHVTGTGLP